MSRLEIIRCAILGAVQGLAEFLPISSSGHLVILHKLFKLEEGNVSFDIIMHVASLLAVIFFFRRQLSTIMRSILMRRQDVERADSIKIVQFIFYASIVTAIIGLSFGSFFERLFNSLNSVAISLILTGIVLFLTKFKQDIAPRREKGLRFPDAALVGLAQGLSFAPGLSRSGMTISFAWIRGIERNLCFHLSFLLSIPTIIGAVLFKMKDITHINVPFGYLLVAFLSAFAFSIVGLRILAKLIQGAKLHYFAYYCWALSLIIFYLVGKGI